MPYDLSKRYQILVYESVTYVYDVPAGVDPEIYKLLVANGTAEPTDKHSHSQGDEIWEVR